MNRRLRKKKRIGEFQELGFEVRAELRSDMTDAEADAFLDRWIDAVEARQLSFGGGTGRGQIFEGFVTGPRRASATDDDRAALAALLDGDPAVVRHDISPLSDAWYG